MHIFERDEVLGHVWVLLPDARKGEEDVDDVNPLKPATGLGELSKHLDWSHLCVEDVLVLEGTQPSLVNKAAEVGACTPINGSFAGLVPRPHDTVLFFRVLDGVIYVDGQVIVDVRGKLLIVRGVHPVCSFVLGVKEDCSEGVTVVGTVEHNCVSLSVTGWSRMRGSYLQTPTRERRTSMMLTRSSLLLALVS